MLVWNWVQNSEPRRRLSRWVQLQRTDKHVFEVDCRQYHKGHLSCVHWDGCAYPVTNAHGIHAMHWKWLRFNLYTQKENWCMAWVYTQCNQEQKSFINLLSQVKGQEIRNTRTSVDYTKL